jgi:hypothetical protein
VERTTANEPSSVANALVPSHDRRRKKDRSGSSAWTKTATATSPPREFLGTADQFKKIDTNKDGFIELKEAEAVKKTATTEKK